MKSAPSRTARALRMLGLWAAEKRGETGVAAEDYARAVIDADISTVPNAALNKLFFDLSAYGVDAIQIRQKRDEFLAIAQRTSV
jgi:hypothetical protein